MLNKIGLVAVGFGFLFIGGTALYDHVFEESDSAASNIFSAKTLEAERDALVAATSGSGGWGRFNTIVRSNTVVSASFTAANHPNHPADGIYQHFANSGWSVCEAPAPAAVQTFAKATYRVSVSPGKGGETYRVSFHTRYRANDADCFPSKNPIPSGARLN